MKILESAPARYDAGIRLLTWGKLDKAYDRLASYLEAGQQVLDIGCGTGALALRAARRGAKVKAIDINIQMLEIAQEKAKAMNLAPNLEFCAMGVAELDCENSENYDVVMSGLCFSELSEYELTYALKEIIRVLKPEGMLLVADEVRPYSVPKRIFNWFLRFPLAIITYILTQATTKAVADLPNMAQETGFLIESVRLNRMGNFMELTCKKPMV